MSYRDGFAALNLEFSPKIPRTEYSAAHCHWELVKRATGMELDLSIPENRPAATRAFLKAWDYGMMWSVLVHRDYLERAGAAVTDMGHAVFSGEDRRRAAAGDGRRRTADRRASRVKPQKRS